MHRLGTLAICLLAGCGTGDDARVAPPPRATVPLAAARPASGEVVLRGEATPVQGRPTSLRGRYVVRFEQRAPEDPGLDFGDQTAFSAQAVPTDPGGRPVELVTAAARSGRRTVRLDGRYVVEASFGDFPFALRLTPVRRP